MLFSFLAGALIVGLVGAAVVGCLAWIASELEETALEIKTANPGISTVAGEIKKKYRSGDFNRVKVGLYAIDEENEEVYEAGSVTVECEEEFDDDVEVGKIFEIA